MRSSNLKICAAMWLCPQLLNNIQNTAVTILLKLAHFTISGHFAENFRERSPPNFACQSVFFLIIYKLKQRSLQVSGDGNNHIVPRTMPHKKCKKIDYKVIYLLHDTQCYQSVTVTSFMEIQRAVQYAWRRNHHKSDTPSSLNNKMWHKAECVFLYFRKYLEQLLHFLCYGAVRLKFSRRLFPLPTS